MARKRRRGLASLRRTLDRAPRNWYRKAAPKNDAAVCYKTKTDALNVFREHNQHIIDELGGESAEHRTSDFDAINHFYDLTGKRRVRTIGGAIWAALPTKRGPYCLEDIDVDTLNDLAFDVLERERFALPDHIQEQLDIEKMAAEQEEDAIDAGIVDQCFTKKRSAKRGRFVKKRAPAPPNKKERSCVCRDDRGRFRKCDPGETSAETRDFWTTNADDVPF